MITFCLLCACLIIGILLVCCVAAGGLVGLLLFGDVLLVLWIVHKIIQNAKKKK